MRHPLRRNLRPMRGLVAAVALAALLAGGIQPLRASATTASSSGTPANPVTTATTAVALVAKAEFTAAERYFSPALQAQMPAASLRQIWEQWTAQLGAYQRQSSVSQLLAGGEDYVFVPCIFTGGRALLAIRVLPPATIDAFVLVGGVQPAGAPAAPITPRAALVRLLTVRPIQTSWFNPGYLSQIYSAVQVGQLIAQITADLGPYEGIAAQSGDVFQVRFQHGTESWFIFLDDQGRIVWLIFADQVQLTLADLHLPSAQARDVAARAAAVDALLATRLHFSGSVLVAVQGKVVLARGYGYMDQAAKRPNTVDTAYRISAITNQFTAMAILKLQEAGKLSVHDRLCRYIQPCPAAWQPVTLQELLSQTSGLPDYMALTPDSRLAQPVTVAQVLGLVEGTPVDFAPGSGYENSYTNYFLLGRVVELASGQPYAAYLQRAIFAPLQLQGTGCDANHPDPRTHAVGYVAWDTPAPYTDMSWFLGSAALYSTVIDLWHWDQAVASSTLISSAATTEMLAPHAVSCPGGSAACGYPGLRTGYAYGWFTGSLGGHPIIDHGGHMLGFTAMNEILPADGITIVLLSNQGSISGANYLGLALAQIMLGQAAG